MWINVKWYAYGEEGEYNIPTSPIKWWILSSFYHTGVWCGIWCFLWAWAVFISPYQKERGDEQAQLPLGVLLRALPAHQTALPISHRQEYVEREKSMAVTLSAAFSWRPWFFREMLRKCLIVMLVSGWGRWIQPFKRKHPYSSMFPLQHGVTKRGELMFFY